MVREYFRLLRVKHYIKNILLFVPLFFAGKFFSLDVWVPTLMGFISFSLMASFVYIVNDIIDVEKDRRHPVKCNRPIASGKIPVTHAIMAAFILAVSAWVILYENFNSIFSKAHVYLLVYTLMNILYSIWLKNIPIVDVMALASGFLIRILYGAALSDIWVSKWLYLTVLVFSLYLGLGKRKKEIEKCKEQETRQVLQYYTKDYLEKIMLMCMSVGVVFYSLWSANITESANISENMIWTVPVILAIVMRYEMLIERADSFGDPVEVLYSDKILVSITVVYGIFCIALLYGNF